MADETPPNDYGDDKGVLEGRRSRQNRRQPTNELSEWGPDVRAPSTADRANSFGAQFPNPPAAALGKGRGAGGTGAPMPASFAGEQQRGNGWAPGPGAADGLSGSRNHAPGNAAGATRQRDAVHGVSAGTGGSEEWPSNQARAMRGLRETNDYEDEKAGLPRRKVGRQPAALGVPTPQPRRSPELADPWQVTDRGEAWRGGEAAPEHLADTLRGLPPRHGGMLPGPQGPGLAATRGTPTPRDEDPLEMAPRGANLHHGLGFPGTAPRWGGATGSDWNAIGAGLGAAELGPVRDHRGVPAALGSLGRRPDLSGMYHGH